MTPHPRSAIVAGALAGILLLAGCSSPATTAAPAAAPAPKPTASVAAVAPAHGGVVGENTVTITGKNLDDVAAVNFGDTTATVQPGATAKSLSVTVPPAPNYQPAAVGIALKDAKGNALATLPKAYDYAVSGPVGKQMQYAFAHWNNYNTKQYGNLNSVGGDCANFVSQTLVARGWTMNDVWYNHDGGSDWSPAWGYVPAMESYFEDNAQALGLTKLGIDQRGQVAVGDVAIFTWSGHGGADHVMVVSKVSADGSSIKLVGHNDDFDYRDLDNTIHVKYPNASVTFWHLGS